MKKRSWYIFEAAAVIISLVIAVTLMIPKFLESQNNINTPQRIPDPNFRTFIETFMGVKPGAAITEEQASMAKGSMDCSNRGIESLKGIEYFVNLKVLRVDHNKLTELPIEHLIELEGLNCNSNQLTHLDVSNSEKIYTVRADDNQIASINLGSASTLILLQVNNNQLESISSFQNHPKLQMLHVHQNNLSFDDLEITQYYHRNLEEFEFEKQNNGSFQVDHIEGVVGFLTSNP